MYENKLKELPYTIELDWNSGNIFLNIPSIDSKLVLSKKDFGTIEDIIKMSDKRFLLREIKPGDEFFVSNDTVKYKILDVTSTTFSKFNTDANATEQILEYVQSNKETIKVYVCINHSKEETHVFLCDNDTDELIFGKHVITAMIVDGNVEKIIAKPYNEMNIISDDGSFLYKRL